MNGCVYRTTDGKCEFYSDHGKGIVSWCDFDDCEEKKPSNADRIRAMTDEELANFIAIQRGRYCDFKDPSEEEYPKVLLWLKSPAEVGAEKCGFEP